MNRNKVDLLQLIQLFSTYYGNDARLNIGPKGFTGEKNTAVLLYWDTEGFAVPLYLALADQSVTRNLLEYRHEQLPGAYHNAKQQGLDEKIVPNGDVQRNRMPQRMGNHV